MLVHCLHFPPYGTKICSFFRLFTGKILNGTWKASSIHFHQCDLNSFRQSSLFSQKTLLGNFILLWCEHLKTFQRLRKSFFFLCRMKTWKGKKYSIRYFSLIIFMSTPCKLPIDWLLMIYDVCCCTFLENFIECLTWAHATIKDETFC